MNTQIDTRSRKAFELVTEAMMDIDQYRLTKEQAPLKSAEAKLGEALSEDPDYVRAMYYKALVNDLVGKAKDAAAQFQQILKKNPPFAEEARYNLGIACYHQYHRDELEKAAGHFRTVINTSNDASLRLLAQAGLAQTYAMLTHHSDPRKPEARVADLHKYFNATKEQYDSVLRNTMEPGAVDNRVLNDILWATYNARGMSLMYLSDGLDSEREKMDSREKKIRLLCHALIELELADKYSPKNWANYCDLGSVHMRLAHWLSAGSESDGEYAKALEYLQEVVDSLRPNYGFALYEIGRAYRLMGEFDRAIDYFKRSKNIDADYRDVRDERLDSEIKRVINEDRTFP